MRNVPTKLPNGELPIGLTGRGVLTICAVVVAALGLASGAEAGEGKKHRHYYVPGYGPGYVVVPPGHVRYLAPAPVVYAAPPPMVVYPAPIAYVPAYPAYGSPGGNLSIGLNLPLH
jgi:hypothetical protein